MDRRRIFMFVLLAGSALSGGVRAEAGHDASSVILVGKGGGYTFKTIAGALEYAIPGDVVLVAPGTYKSYKPKPGVVVKPTEAGGVKIVGSGGGGSVGGWNDDDPTALEKNVGGVGNNIANTDEQIVKELLQGEDGAWNEIDAILSGKIVTKEVNKVINKGTNAVTGAIDDTIDSATDAVTDPVEDAIDSYVDAAVETVECTFGGSAAAMAAGAVTSIWGGGDATYGAQLAQWLTQTASNWCQSKHVAVASQQLKVEKRQRDLMKRMVEGLDSNAAADASEVENFSRDVLGSSDKALYGANQEKIIWDRYQSGMPAGWTFDDAAEHTRRMREQTNLASQEAAAAQAAARASIGSALKMAEKAQKLSLEANGQTQATQAQTQMLRSQIAIDASRQAADAANATAALRMEEERRAQEVFADQKMERFYGPGVLNLNAPPARAVFN